MTAPAKAAPMREDVTPLIEMLCATTREEGCTVFEHSPEEIGVAVMEAHGEVLSRLAMVDIEAIAKIADQHADEAATAVYDLVGDPGAQSVAAGRHMAAISIAKAIRAHTARPDAGDSKRVDRWRKASVALGGWMSAALDDPKVCDAMKADINEWFSAGEPFEGMTARPDAGDEDVERVARVIAPRSWWEYDRFVDPDSQPKTQHFVMIYREGLTTPAQWKKWWAEDAAPPYVDYHISEWRSSLRKAREIAAMREGVDRGMVERAKALIDDAMDNAGAFEPGEVVVPISVAYAVSAAVLEQPR